jgi:hypothetical protein
MALTMVDVTIKTHLIHNVLIKSLVIMDVHVEMHLALIIVDAPCGMHFALTNTSLLDHTYPTMFPLKP